MFIVLDRVFGCDCSTEQVYKEGAKEVALSVVGGINCEYQLVFLFLHISPSFLEFQLVNCWICVAASVFAYGQTSSGKTFTMTGITEYTIADIFDHIHKVIHDQDLIHHLFVVVLVLYR